MPTDEAPKSTLYNELRLVDIAARIRDSYGPERAEVLFPGLPEHDWRFEATFRLNGCVTFGPNVTADFAARYLETCQ